MSLHTHFIVVARHIAQVQGRVPDGAVIIDVDVDIICVPLSVTTLASVSYLPLSLKPSSISILGSEDFAPPVVVFCFFESPALPAPDLFFGGIVVELLNGKSTVTVQIRENTVRDARL